MNPYESSFNMPQMSSLGGDTFNLGDINDILNECETENKNEEQARKHIRGLQQTNLRIKALKQQQNQANAELSQIKEQTSSHKQRVTYIRQQKQHILQKHQALQLEQFSIRNTLDKNMKELEYCKEKRAKAKASMAFIKSTVEPLRVDM